MAEKFDITQHQCLEIDEFITNYKGKLVPCQFHEDKHPSAQVNETNVYCHVCQKPYFYKAKDPYKKNRETEEGCHTALLGAPNQSKVRAYLKKRSIRKNDIINDFKLGYHANKDKLVIPIKNRHGDVNGFAYVSLEDETATRYINSSSSTTGNDIDFCKTNNLFGVDKVTSECRHLIICEGYFDVISAYSAGNSSNTVFVGLMGTALSEDHMPLLKYLMKEGVQSISLMLDRDGAGFKATLRCIKKLLNNSIFPTIVSYGQLQLESDNDCLSCEKGFSVFSDAKDVDELLRNEGGPEHLEHLLDKHCIDWLDYLYLMRLQNDDMKKYIEAISSKEKKGEYAFKYCKKNKLTLPAKQSCVNEKSIISLNKDSLKDYLLQEECYFSHKLPDYFKFDKMLKWAVKNADNFDKNKFGDLERSNYHIISNKDGEYSWRQLQLINPIIYVKIVNLICEKWGDLTSYFCKKTNLTKGNICCYSLPVKKPKIDRFTNNKARQIVNWWEEIEQQSIKLSLEYKCLIHTDIVDCYGSIYTHAIPQAIYGKTEAKKNTKAHNFGNELDHLEVRPECWLKGLKSILNDNQLFLQRHSYQA